MSDESRLPTDILTSAIIRTAAREGIAIVVRQRGDNANGAVLLKINKLDGTARVLSQARFDEEVIWNPVSRKDPMSEAEAEIYLEKQLRMDPDLWLIEIEDKEGRLWFPGRIAEFN
ncbi:MAG: DUF1491 family protein [Alphaproteobacteria bacterium]